jgi:hypothetical protein
MKSRRRGRELEGGELLVQIHGGGGGGGACSW